MLARTWEAPAAYSRRKAQYRCRCCGKIIAEGVPAIYARMAKSRGIRGNRVWAIHAECGDKRHSEAYSWREVMAEWGKP